MTHPQKAGRKQNISRFSHISLRGILPYKKREVAETKQVSFYPHRFNNKYYICSKQKNIYGIGNKSIRLSF